MGLVTLVFALVALVAGNGYDTIRYCHGDPTFVNTQRPGFQLLQVQLLHRHGDRTPVHSLPGFLENVSWNCSDSVLEDVEVDDSLKLRKVYYEGRQALRGNCMLGQLTGRGERQLNALGSQFRRMYVDTHGFMPAKMDPSQLKLRSTDVERTIRSAYHFLSGLYPDSQETVDLEIVERQMDNSFPNKQFCPYFGKALKDLRKEANYSQYYNKYLVPMEEKYSKLWKYPVDLTVVDDALRARFCHGFDMPPLMDKEDAHQIMHGVSHLENMLQSSMFVHQLSVGSFFGDWIRNLELEPRPKLVLYSNHDSTLRAILSAFQVFDDVWPAYASHLAIELWEDMSSGKHFVTFQYNGRVHRLREPCKSEFCFFGDFVKLLNSFRTEMCDEPTGTLNLELQSEMPPPRLKPLKADQ